MRTSLEVGIKVHRFAGIFPEQFLTEAGRHREAVVAPDQRMVIRCFRDDLAGFVHDVSHVPPPIQCAGFVDAPIDRALVQAMYPKPGSAIGSSEPFKEQHAPIAFVSGCSSHSLSPTRSSGLNVHAPQGREAREPTVLDIFVMAYRELAGSS